MMSYAALAAWSRPILSHCCTEHGYRCGVVLSSRITTIAMSMSDQLGRHCTIAACPHVLQVMMAQVSRIHASAHWKHTSLAT
jgi:hypothetical protein